MEQFDLFDTLDFEVKENQIKEFCNKNNAIILKSYVKKDEYTDYIHQSFDLEVKDICQVDIPNNLNIENLNDWNIGVICGASGSGKSTILNHIAKGDIQKPIFDNSKSLISNFENLSPKDATFLLSSMGLSSVPTWIRPYNVLSNGEKYRADLAKIVSSSNHGDIIFVDEYTSVVDRNVAKSMSNALQKYIRRNNKKIILATCHYDIIEWLQPNWIYDLNKGGVLEKYDYLRQSRPTINLQVFRTTHDTWDRFKKYHYMTEDLNTSASCFCFTWNNQLVGFVGVLAMPCGTVQNAFRGSRTVVLPDFQGLGIGSKITEFIASCYKSIGARYYTKTVNPALGEYRNNSEKWKETSHNGKFRNDVIGNKDNKGYSYLPRISYCHEYIGEPTYGYEDLIKPIGEIRYEKSIKNQLTLF